MFELSSLFSIDGSVFLQLLLALFLGMLLGTERTFSGRTAGMRTYALVSLGSCLLIVISEYVIKLSPGSTALDPLHLMAGIVTGIGFLGAGVIFHTAENTTGLTTAAGIWVTCAIGIAIGYKLYGLAVFVTVATLVIFSLLWAVEKQIKKVSIKIHGPKNTLE